MQAPVGGKKSGGKKEGRAEKVKKKTQRIGGSKLRNTPPSKDKPGRTNWTLGLHRNETGKRADGREENTKGRRLKRKAVRGKESTKNSEVKRKRKKGKTGHTKKKKTLRENKTPRGSKKSGMKDERAMCNLENIGGQEDEGGKKPHARGRKRGSYKRGKKKLQGSQLQRQRKGEHGSITVVRGNWGVRK